MFAALLLAGWLGILTSISPCPLTSNIAALSFITKELGQPRRALAAGMLYTAGRSATYILLAFTIVQSMATIPHLSIFLQTTVSKLLGPLFILIGMVLLGLLPVPFFGGSPLGQAAATRLQAKGLLGSFVLGAILALAFCPVSAALYFGSLIPLSVQHLSSLLLPTVYGIGTALPVLAFGVAVTLGTQPMVKAFHAASVVQVWGNRITGTVFVLIGLYLSLSHVFGVV